MSKPHAPPLTIMKTHPKFQNRLVLICSRNCCALKNSTVIIDIKVNFRKMTKFTQVETK